MKFCVQCGNQLTEGATFCTSCGARVAPETSHAHGDDAPTQMARPVSESSVRLPGSGSRPDDGQGAARPSLGASAYPAPPTQDDASASGGHEAPQRLGQQYDWSQGASNGQNDTSTTPETTATPSDDSSSVSANSAAGRSTSSDATQQMPQGQQYGSQQYESNQDGGQYPSSPQSGYASAPHQGYDSAQQHGQFGGQQYASASQQGYASAPYASNAPQGVQYGSAPQGGVPQNQGMQNQGMQNQGVQGGAQAQRPAIDWKALTPGLLRLLAAVTLALTALGNWWTGNNTSSPDTYGTTHSVFALIGCIGVVLSCIAQIAVLPQFLGAAMQPIARFGVRAVLCLPALIAVVIAIMTNLGGPDSGKASFFAVTLLAMAIGFALAGLDDAREAVPADGLRWCAVGLAGLGIVLNIVSMIQFMGADSYDDHAKEMWLIGIFSLIFVAAIGGLVIWLGVARPAFGTGLVVALAGAVAFSAITRGWICSNESLSAMTPARHGHGAALIALALALATAHEVTARGRDDARDDASIARRMTQWVVQGFVVAAVAAAFNALAFVGARGDDTPGGVTWFLVLMIVTALVYGACAFLLKTNPMGRLVAVISAVTISLTILITIAASKSSGSFCEAFTEGAYLWLPLVAAAALTIPPAVRRVAGPIAPQARSTAPQGDAQQQFAQAPQGQFGQGQQFSQGPFGHTGQGENQGQYGQDPQQWNGQQSQDFGQNGQG